MKTKRVQLKDLQPGMKIKTLHDGKIVFKTVERVWETQVALKDQRVVTIGDITLRCSSNHPLMLSETEQVLPDSAVGKLVVTDTDGKLVEVDEVKSDSRDTTYIDITVEDTHTFFASDSQDGQMVLTHNSQGGIRNASATINLPIWHYQFDDFIVLKNNQGTDETRVRQMDYCVVLSAFFWRRLKQQGNITFFDPNEVPGLYEAFYRSSEEFEKLYVACEKRKDLRVKVESAEKVFGWLMKERSDTGRYYLLNIDNVSNQGPFDTTAHPIYQTNLCFSGETLVAVADGRNAVSLRQLEEEGKTFNVFAARKAGGRSLMRGRRNGGKLKTPEWKTVIRKARAVKTGLQQLVRVHLEDGDYFDATPDHRLATTSYGKWVEAGKSEGATLEPFATKALGAKYRGISSTTDSYQHRAIWEHANGPLPKGCDIDHIDNLGNDELSNLQILTKAEHLIKTAAEISGAGNNIHRLDKSHHSVIAARTSFLSRNPRYSGFTDEQLIILAQQLANSTKLTVNGLSRHFSQNGGPKTLSKNRFQRFKEAGFNNSWQYLIACAEGRAQYLSPIDYTTETKFRYETRSPKLNWTWEEGAGGRAWKGRRVTRVEPLGVQACYDVQVIDDGLSDDEHNFYIITSGDDDYRTSRGVLVHNCTEIMLPTRQFQTIDDSAGRIALCTLGSLNWGKFRHPEEMKRPTRLLHRALHNLLQYQDFLSVQSEMHNKEFEPLGIGVTNLAYWHAKRKLKYGEGEALAEVKRWMEHQAFYLTEMSVELAEEKGKCLESDSTWYGKGVFPWERRAKGAEELTDFTPEMAWEPLRERMKKSGVRNATLMAIAPVESSSVVLNSTNGINLLKQLIVIKESKAGIVPQVAPEFRKLRKHYELLFDQPDCLPYIKTAAVLQAYIDQGISSDTFYSGRHFKDGKIPLTLVTKNLMLAHRYGLKSHYYHLVDKQASQLSAREEESKPAEVVEEAFCESCVL
jgi:ribonucleotide reductase alpha subunit